MWIFLFDDNEQIQQGMCFAFLKSKGKEDHLKILFVNCCSSSTLQLSSTIFMFVFPPKPSAYKSLSLDSKEELCQQRMNWNQNASPTTAPFCELKRKALMALCSEGFGVESYLEH
jgi:hypothetical protein